MGLIQRVLNDESGATAIEYGLIVALVAVASITALKSVGVSLSATFSTVATNL